MYCCAKTGSPSRLIMNRIEEESERKREGRGCTSRGAFSHHFARDGTAYISSGRSPRRIPCQIFQLLSPACDKRAGEGKHRYRCPLKDKRYLRAIREPIRIRPEFDGGIRVHFTFPSERNPKFLPVEESARKLSISRHSSSGRGASFFAMALNGRDLLTTKRFTTDTHPELHSAQSVQLCSIKIKFDDHWRWNEIQSLQKIRNFPSQNDFKRYRSVNG